MLEPTRKTLLGLIAEYGDSLERIRAEKDLMKAMELRASNECSIPAPAFRAVATAHWRDEVQKTHQAIKQEMDLFDLVQASPIRVAIDTPVEP